MLSAWQEAPYMALSNFESVHHAGSLSCLPDHDFSLMGAIGNTPLGADGAVVTLMVDSGLKYMSTDVCG